MFTRPMFQAKLVADVVPAGPTPHFVTMQIGAIRGDSAARGEAPALYNLAEDIAEKNNLAASNPEKMKELETAWDAWNAQNMPPRWRNAGDVKAEKMKAEREAQKKGARPGAKKTGAAEDEGDESE